MTGARSTGASLPALLLLLSLGACDHGEGSARGRLKPPLAEPPQLWLVQTLDEAGFDVVEMGAVLHCPRPLSVPLTRIAERYGGPAMQRGLLRLLAGFERAGNWPTKFRTGYFLCARAVKR